MRRMEKITGRSDDMIILRGVNLFPTQIEELILRVPALSPHFQCGLTARRPAGPDDGRVERRDRRRCDAARRGRRRARALVKDTIGVSVAVTWCP